MNVPSLPVIVTWYVPTGLPAGTVTVNPSVTGVAEVIDTEGEVRLVLKVGDISLGPAAARSTVPVNPLRGVTVTVVAISVGTVDPT